MLLVARFVFVIAIFGMLFVCGCGGDSSEDESQEVVSEDVSEPEPEPEVVIMEFDPDTPEAELQDVISDVISYLESGDIDGMLDRYIPPDDLEGLIERGRLGKVAIRYRMFKDDMAVTLKEGLSLQPTFNDDTTGAVYEVESSPSPLAFVKIGDKWYFPNK